MKRSSVIVSFLLLAMSVSAWAGESQKSSPSDFWTRPTLTGDWGGARNDLAAKGITLDMSLTQTGMSVVSGGKHHGWKYNGRGDLTLTVDTQKL